MTRIGLTLLSLLCALPVASHFANPLEAGTIETASIASPVLDSDIPVSVYRPDGDGPWPVLYLLHGYGGGHQDWVNAGYVEATADRVFGEDGTQPFLIVMPGAQKLVVRR